MKLLLTIILIIISGIELFWLKDVDANYSFFTIAGAIVFYSCINLIQKIKLFDKIEISMNDKPSVED